MANTVWATLMVANSIYILAGIYSFVSAQIFQYELKNSYWHYQVGYPDSQYNRFGGVFILLFYLEKFWVHSRGITIVINGSNNNPK